jgi:hypothetical protein
MSAFTVAMKLKGDNGMEPMRPALDGLAVDRIIKR